MSSAPVEITQRMFVTSTGDVLPNEIAGSKRFTFSGNRSFCIKGSGPAAEINKRAVSLAMADETAAAKILFETLVDDATARPCALNNLGLLSELAGDRENALALYSQACSLEPTNTLFKKNRLYLLYGR